LIPALNREKAPARLPGLFHWPAQRCAMRLQDFPAFCGTFRTVARSLDEDNKTGERIMKRFATIALAFGMAAAPALAETHMDSENLIRTRDITGGDIYTLNGPMDEDTWGNWESEGVGPDWNDIGEIEDIILDRSGQMVGVVAEIGGFLDVGDKHVMIPVGDMRLTPVDDKRYVIVTRFTEEQLEEMPSVDEGWWD
jgi:hypothetical protein